MRLSLCCLMVSAQTPDLFIVDEPTNNIDIMNMEILTDTLKEYRGTLLVVSHDACFVQQINIEKTITLKYVMKTARIQIYGKSDKYACIYGIVRK